MGKGRRPERAQEGLIYLIKHKDSDIHKIGITLDWARRAKQLEVGQKVEPVIVERVLSPRRLERDLHERFAKQRIPQSEWFHLSPAQVGEVKAAFAAAAEQYKQWAQKLQPPATTALARKPQPYRIAKPEPITRQAPTPATQRDPQPYRIRKPEAPPAPPPVQAKAPKREPIGWGGAIAASTFMSLCFPLLPIIFGALSGWESSGTAFFLGLAVQITLFSRWMYFSDSDR